MVWVVVPHIGTWDPVAIAALQERMRRPVGGQCSLPAVWLFTVTLDP